MKNRKIILMFLNSNRHVYNDIVERYFYIGTCSVIFKEVIYKALSVIFSDVVYTVTEKIDPTGYICRKKYIPKVNLQEQYDKDKKNIIISKIPNHVYYKPGITIIVNLSNIKISTSEFTEKLLNQLGSVDYGILIKDLGYWKTKIDLKQKPTREYYIINTLNYLP